MLHRSAAGRCNIAPTEWDAGCKPDIENQEHR